MPEQRSTLARGFSPTPDIKLPWWRRLKELWSHYFYLTFVLPFFGSLVWVALSLFVPSIRNDILTIVLSLFLPGLFMLGFKLHIKQQLLGELVDIHERAVRYELLKEIKAGGVSPDLTFRAPTTRLLPTVRELNILHRRAKMVQMMSFSTIFGLSAFVFSFGLSLLASKIAGDSPSYLWVAHFAFDRLCMGFFFDFPEVYGVSFGAGDVSDLAYRHADFAMRFLGNIFGGFALAMALGILSAPVRFRHKMKEDNGSALIAFSEELKNKYLFFWKFYQLPFWKHPTDAEAIQSGILDHRTKNEALVEDYVSEHIEELVERWAAELEIENFGERSKA